MTCSRWMAAALAAVLCAATAANAQQRIPQPQVNVGQGLPAAEVRGGPSLPNSGTVTPHRMAVEDACVFADVGAAELSGTRALILDLLAGIDGARANFEKNEALLPGNCPRRQAAFYLQVLARIKAAKPEPR